MTLRRKLKPQLIWHPYWCPISGLIKQLHSACSLKPPSPTSRIQTNPQDLRSWCRIYPKRLQFKSRTSSFVLPPRLHLMTWKTPSYDDFSHRRQDAWPSCCSNSRTFLSHQLIFIRRFHPDLWLFRRKTSQLFTRLKFQPTSRLGKWSLCGQFMWEFPKPNTCVISTVKPCHLNGVPSRFNGSVYI